MADTVAHNSADQADGQTTQAEYEATAHHLIVFDSSGGHTHNGSGNNGTPVTGIGAATVSGTVTVGGQTLSLSSNINLISSSAGTLRDIYLIASDGGAISGNLGPNLVLRAQDADGVPSIQFQYSGGTTPVNGLTIFNDSSNSVFASWQSGHYMQFYTFCDTRVNANGDEIHFRLAPGPVSATIGYSDAEFLNTGWFRIFSDTGVTEKFAINGQTGEIYIKSHIEIANALDIRTSTATGQQFGLSAYDVDNTAYTELISLTSGNTVLFTVGSTTNSPTQTLVGTWATSSFVLGATTFSGHILLNADASYNIGDTTNQVNILYAYDFRNSKNNDLNIRASGGTSSAIVFLTGVTPTERFRLSGATTSIATWSATTQVGLTLGGSMDASHYLIDRVGELRDTDDGQLTYSVFYNGAGAGHVFRTTDAAGTGYLTRLTIGTFATTTDIDITNANLDLNGNLIDNVNYIVDNSATPPAAGFIRVGHGVYALIGMNNAGASARELISWGIAGTDILRIGEDATSINIGGAGIGTTFDGAITMTTNMDAGTAAIANASGMTGYASANSLTISGGVANAQRDIVFKTVNAAGDTLYERMRFGSDGEIIAITWSNVTQYGLVLGNAMDFNGQAATNVGAAGNDFGATNSLVATTFSGTVDLNVQTLSGWNLIVGRTDAFGNVVLRGGANAGSGNTIDIETGIGSGSTHATRMVFGVGATVSRIQVSAGGCLNVAGGTHGTPVEGDLRINSNKLEVYLGAGWEVVTSA